MTRISDAGLKVNNAADDRQYSAAEVIAVLDSAINGGGGGGGGSTTNRTHQIASYQTFTNPTNVYFTALDINGVDVLVARTTTGVSLIAGDYRLYGYNMPLESGLTDFLAVWDEGDADNFTIAWEIVGAGAGIVGPPVPGAGIATAHWTMTQSESSLVTLDATLSTADTYAWTIDGVPRPEITPTISYGPLEVGIHTVSLTVTKAFDNSTDVLASDVAVAWIADTIDGAQVDATNGFPVSGIGLAPWSPLPAIGPWRRKVILNEEDGGDNIARVTTVDGEMSLLVKAGDQPGSEEGYRAGMEMTSTYSGLAAGYPLGATDINLAGTVQTGGTTGLTRFYRVEFRIEGPNADATDPPGFPTSLDFQKSFAAIQGNWPSVPLVEWAPSVDGTEVEVRFNEGLDGGAVTGTPQAFDTDTIHWNTWYNYIVELRPSLDDTIGYVRVYRDGVVVTTVPSGTDAEGRYFAITQQTDDGDLPVDYSFALENSRDQALIDAELSPPNDVTITYRNCSVGPTYASVTGVPLAESVVVLDYDTGDASQWTNVQGEHYPGYSLTFDNTRTRHGTGYSARTEVRAGDDPLNLGSNTERCDVLYSGADKNFNEGDETWFGWSNYFDSALYVPTDTAATNCINTFFDWHENRGPNFEFTSTAAVPPCSLNVDTNSYTYPYKFSFKVTGGPLDSPNGFPLAGQHTYVIGDVLYDQWIDWVIHSIFSVDAGIGLCEFWMNGVKVVTFNGATLYPGRQNYLKQAHYRTASPDTSVLFHDQGRLGGSSYADVDPSVVR